MLNRDSTKVIEDYDVIKQVYVNVPYKFKLIRPADAKIVIKVNDALYCLRNVDGNLINPQKLGLKSKNEERKSDYEVYCMSTETGSGRFGNKIFMHKGIIGDYKGEVFVRITYNYHIINGIKLYKILDKRKTKYSSRDIIAIIRASMDKLVTNAMMLYQFNGDIDSVDVKMLALYLEEKVGEELVMKIGINIFNISVEIESVTDSKVTIDKAKTNAKEENMEVINYV